MSYQKQGFYSGGDLYASQLDAMEDGIINAEKLAEEAALKGVQADYNENDSTSASYIKNRPFYEEKLWKEIANGTYTSEPREDLMGLYGAQVRYSESIEIPQVVNVIVDGVGYDNLSVTYIDEMALHCVGNLSYLSAFGLTYENTGEPFIFALGTSGGVLVVDPSNSTTNTFTMEIFVENIVKIDEKFLPELSSGANMEEGTGENATQQSPRPDKTNLINDQGQLCFEGDNPFAGADDDLVPYGAFGKSSVSLGGRSCAYATHSMATNSKTVALGEESLATGYATIAAGGASFSGGSQTIARAEASTALGHKNEAAAPYTFVHGVQNVAGGLYQAVFGVANENNTDNLFEIGNGKLDAKGNVIKRENAFAVTRDGRVKVQNLNIQDMEVNDLVPMAVLNQTAANLTISLQTKLNDYQVGQYIRNGSANGSIQQKYGSASQVGAAAFGTHTQANAEASMSCGAHTVADKYAQTVVGKFNNIISREGSLFVIGGGGDKARKNVLEVISDGEIIIYWEGNYYSLNLMLNLIANKFGGTSFFDEAKK